MPWTKKLALGLAVTFGVLFLFLTVEHFRGKWGLARWKAQMIAKGAPLSIAEVAAPAVQTNGMSALIMAISNIPANVRWVSVLPHPGSNKIASMLKTNQFPASGKVITWAAVGEELAGCEGVITNGLTALTAYSEFQTELDYKQGWHMLLPHLASLWRFSEVLCASALYELHHGRVAAGVTRLEAAIQCLAIHGSEPVWVSKLSRCFRVHSVFATTWHAAEANVLRDEHLRRLQEAWGQLDFVRDVPSAFRMEAAITKHEFENLRTSRKSLSEWLPSLNSPPPVAPPVSIMDAFVRSLEDAPAYITRGFTEHIYAPIWKFAWLRHDELEILELLEQRIEAFHIATRENSAVRLTIFGDDYEATATSEFRAFWAKKPYDWLRYNVSPRQEKFYSSLHRPFMAQTQRELAVAGLALKRHVLRHTNAPTKLEMLIPEFLRGMPRDFMDGKHLQYEVGAEGYLLRSAGDLFWPQAAEE